MSDRASRDDHGHDEPVLGNIAASKEIQRRTGRTFHVATRLLPPRVREATYVLYAFFRVADEVVDDPGDDSPSVQRAKLEDIRRAAVGEKTVEDPVLEAFQTVRDRYDIPDREIESFIDAMAMDVDRRRYETFDDLQDYLRGSSVAVGYMMLAVMQPDDVSAAKPHAKALGEAFQLTNFLRDVREDILEYDRIYLPGSTLAQYGVSESSIERLQFDEGVAAAMRAELRRTERLYREGVAGISKLPADCRFPVLLAAVLYAEHHRLIRRQHYDVLSKRPTLSHWRRLLLVAKTWYQYRKLGDPVETFERVSAVPRRGSEGSAQSILRPRSGSQDGAGFTRVLQRGAADLRARLGDLV